MRIRFSPTPGFGGVVRVPTTGYIRVGGGNHVRRSVCFVHSSGAETSCSEAQTESVAETAGPMTSGGNRNPWLLGVLVVIGVVCPSPPQLDGTNPLMPTAKGDSTWR